MGRKLQWCSHRRTGLGGQNENFPFSPTCQKVSSGDEDGNILECIIIYHNFYIGGRGKDDIFDYYTAYFPQ
jgi:hypothetical protein